MTESLHDAKARLRNKYIGRHGVHSLGTRPERNAIVVYFEPGHTPQQLQLLEELRVDAGGFEIIEVAEAPPKTGPRKEPV